MSSKLAGLTYSPTTMIYTVWERETSIVVKDFLKSLGEAAEWCHANGWELQSPAPIGVTSPSITRQPLFRPKLKRVVSMEQLRSAFVAFMNDLDPKDDLFASIEDDENFYNSFQLFLEESFNWPDYHSHN